MMASAMPVPPAAASAAPPATTVPAPSQLLRPSDVRREVQREIKNLESKDENALLKATASLVMLATLPDSVSHLSLAITHLVCLLRLDEQTTVVKKNACAALSSIINASPMLYLSVAQSPGLVEALVSCLKTEDESLQLNAAAACSLLAQREEGLVKLREAAADDVLISKLNSASGELLEEIVDAICCLASHESMREIFLQKGVVSPLAGLIKSSSEDICVRALLALGMICGSNTSAQIELAKAEGSVQTLLELTRSPDNDIKAISRDLFKALGVNETTRPLVERCLRNTS